MIDLCRILIILCFVLGARALQAQTADGTTHTDLIRYAYPNDSKSSISVSYERIYPHLPSSNEWLMVAKITSEPLISDDIWDTFDTTGSSTMSKINDALSSSLDAFHRKQPKAVMSHLYCSTSITSDTLATFESWIACAKTEKIQREQSKVLEERIRTYRFDPLRADLNSILSPYGYKIAKIEGPEKPRMFEGVDANVLLDSLAKEGLYYYIKFERVK